MMQQQREQHRPEAAVVAVSNTPAVQTQQVSTGLTNHLHHTAENVMKWKMQLEGEIKQRDKKIADCQEMIKNMKSSLLSQQQHSEALSHKLQIELLKRGDINMRIETTRNISSSLQQHCNYLADAVKKCYDEKDLIKSAQVEYVSELEKLMEKTDNYNMLMASLTKERDGLLTAYLNEKQDRVRILEDANSLKGIFYQRMEDARKAVSRETEKVTKLVESLKCCENKYNALEALKLDLEKQLKMCKDQMEEMEFSYKTSFNNLEMKLKEKDLVLGEEKARVADLEAQFNSLKTSFANLEDSNKLYMERIEQSTAQVTDLNIKLDEYTQADMIKSKEIEALLQEKLVLEDKVAILADLQNELANLNMEVIKITDEKCCLTSKFEACEDERAKFKQDLIICQNDLNDVKSNLEVAKNDLCAIQEEKLSLTKELNIAEEKLQIELQEKKALQEKLDLELCDSLELKNALEKLSSASATESGALANEVLELKRSVSQLKVELQHKESSLSKMALEVESLKTNKSEMYSTLISEKDNSKKKLSALQSKLDEKNGELETSKSSLNTMQASLQSLQEDIDGLHNQLKEANDEREALVVEKKEIEKSLKTVKSEKSTAENKLKRLETKANNLEKDKKELKDKLAKVRSESLEKNEKKEQELSDFEETIKEKDELIAELEQSINECKTANEEELKSKDTKLQELNKDQKKITDKLDATVKEKAELELKLSKMTTQLADTIKSLNEISKKYEGQNHKLKEQLSVKSTEVSKLQSQLSSQNSAVSTHSMKKIVPESPSLASEESTDLGNFLVGGVSQRWPSQSKKSIIKGVNKRSASSKGRKLTFSDTISYISLEEDETSSISSAQAPNTPNKARAVANVPTTPLKSYADPNTPKKSTRVGDDDSDVSSFGDLFMDEKEVQQKLEQLKSPSLGKMKSHITPTKRPVIVAEADAPQKMKRSRLGAVNTKKGIK